MAATGTGLDVDHWLRMYLLRCKNSIERTKESLDVLLSGRSTIPEFFRQRDPTAPDVQGSFDTTLIATMPRLTPDGYRVHYYAYPTADAKGFQVEALFRRALMMGEILMRDDLPAGEIIVVDLANGNASRFRDFTLAMSLFSKFVRAGLKMYPLRLKHFYLINLPPFLNAIMTLLGTVMREKLYSRIIVDPTGCNELKKNIPAECIPEDYGGEGPSLREGNGERRRGGEVRLDNVIEELMGLCSPGLWRSLLVENRDWFLAQESIRTDESKRVGTSSFMDEISCPGSFRTLAVD
ncbi:hypothetical protein FOCC_FOCC007990 [Frankliniella occidentalis]|nr:hypothetical protein FOCC_FOCC007990 [Frankliniella occidentalis]